MSASTYNWHQVVWDAATSGSTSAEAWEIARGINHDWTNAGNYDANAAAYCHDLTESGLTDWRTPTTTEVAAEFTSGSNFTCLGKLGA